MIGTGGGTSCCLVGLDAGAFLKTALLPAAAATAAAPSEVRWAFMGGLRLGRCAEKACVAPRRAAFGFPTLALLGTNFGGHDSALEVMEPSSLQYCTK